MDSLGQPKCYQISGWTSNIWRDWRGMDIFNKLRTLCNTCVLHLQWIPSHANLKYKDSADSLAKEGPGAAIRFKGVTKGQTALARLSSGHLKTHRFSRGDKKFNICTKCNMIDATPQHLLDCVALVYDDLLKRPEFVLEGERSHGYDLIQIRRISKKKKRQTYGNLDHLLHVVHYRKYCWRISADPKLMSMLMGLQ
ncbi:hypothetical protein AVEN_263118-1 [Araneus ventricosus]|uniref:RNase H type-1 domain-containing protein n=1 Tax=Araneus ventricosus TaxID=182803 RepID=A0A4Y2TY81_ARAVE|nr:hypothetical protein AVEN_263118-1 [Araneus ventricosus]